MIWLYAICALIGAAVFAFVTQRLLDAASRRHAEREKELPEHVARRYWEG